jgi:hypothetical protein
MSLAHEGPDAVRVALAPDPWQRGRDGWLWRAVSS